MGQGQLIHYKVINRACITPSLLHEMKFTSNPYCHLCNKSTIGSCIHMFWECHIEVSFWTFVCTVLLDILQLEIPMDPLLFLLLDDSTPAKHTSKNDFTCSRHSHQKYCFKALGGTIHFYTFHLANILQRHCFVGRYHH